MPITPKSTTCSARTYLAAEAEQGLVIEIMSGVATHDQGALLVSCTAGSGRIRPTGPLSELLLERLQAGDQLRLQGPLLSPRGAPGARKDAVQAESDTMGARRGFATADLLPVAQIAAPLAARGETCMGGC